MTWIIQPQLRVSQSAGVYTKMYNLSASYMMLLKRCEENPGNNDVYKNNNTHKIRLIMSPCATITIYYCLFTQLVNFSVRLIFVYTRLGLYKNLTTCTAYIVQLHIWIAIHFWPVFVKGTARDVLAASCIPKINASKGDLGSRKAMPPAILLKWAGINFKSPTHAYQCWVSESCQVKI